MTGAVLEGGRGDSLSRGRRQLVQTALADGLAVRRAKMGEITFFLVIGKVQWGGAGIDVRERRRAVAVPLNE